MTKFQDRSMLPRAALAAAMLFSFACSSGSSGAPDGNGGANGGAGGEAGKGSGKGGGAAGSPGNGGGAAGAGTGGTAGAGGLGGHAGANAAGAGGGAAGHGGAGGGPPTTGSPCESNNDCGSSTFLFCLAPGESRGCGTCRQAQSTCSSDTDCGSPDGGVAVAHMICDAAPSSQCYCSSTYICQIGCRTKSDCAAGQGCNAHHQCQDTCTPGAATCPANFSCSADGFCIQDSCTDDSQCSGACVKGSCYSTRGTCEPRAA
jgi:hypothetical protein